MSKLSRQVNDLFTIFENNSHTIEVEDKQGCRDETLISTYGLVELTHSFGLVPLDDRADVWEGFLHLLYKTDYVKNIDSFLNQAGSSVSNLT